jgi:3-keto-disaccharide hydrolase
MNETAPGRESEGEAPPPGPIPYVCTDCRRTFSIPAGAPSQMDGLAVEGLTCPWCGRWAVPARDGLPVTGAKRSVAGTTVVWIAAMVLAGLVGVLGYLAWTEKDDAEADGEESAAVWRMDRLAQWFGIHSFRGSGAMADELSVPPSTPTERFDFAQKGIEGWRSIDGQWAVEGMAGAPSGERVLVQRAVQNAFNVIVAPGGPYRDVDVSVRFKPISGREDASGGIVFRFTDARYYVVRANALENNFRLYSYDRGRRQLASATVEPPALGQWHTVRVVAVGDRIQGYLNGKLLLDQRDARFRSGQVGLWTKADSITAFDDLTVCGVNGGG